MRKWLVAAALLAFTGPALAQATDVPPNATADTAPAAPARPEVTPPPAPERPTVSTQSAAERVTTPKPSLPTGPGALAPPPPAEATGQGSASPTLPGPNAPGGIERLRPDGKIGQPQGDWNLQTQVTDIGREGRWMNDVLLLPLMAGVCLVVFGLLFYAIVSFRRKDGKDPAKFSHNTTVEVVWTLVPVLILVVIAVPSFQLLADQYDPPKPDLTIKATGHQWYWEYEYPDQGGFSFDAVMLSDADAAKQGSPRLLDTDNRVVVPVGATVKVLTTAADVIHAWMVPAFWVQMDAVPGRVNETWFKADKVGVYYGQCFQVCGTRHPYMPIAVEVVPPARFAAWVRAKQAEAGIEPGGSTAQAAPAPAAPPAGDGPTTEAVAARPVEPAATPGAGSAQGRNAGNAGSATN